FNNADTYELPNFAILFDELEVFSYRNSHSQNASSLTYWTEVGPNLTTITIYNVNFNSPPTFCNTTEALSQLRILRLEFCHVMHGILGPGCSSASVMPEMLELNIQSSQNLGLANLAVDAFQARDIERVYVNTGGEGTIPPYWIEQGPKMIQVAIADLALVGFSDYYVAGATLSYLNNQGFTTIIFAENNFYCPAIARPFGRPDVSYILDFPTTGQCNQCFGDDSGPCTDPTQLCVGYVNNGDYVCMDTVTVRNSSCDDHYYGSECQQFDFCWNIIGPCVNAPDQPMPVYYFVNYWWTSVGNDVISNTLLLAAQCAHATIEWSTECSYQIEGLTVITTALRAWIYYNQPQYGNAVLYYDTSDPMAGLIIGTECQFLRAAIEESECGNDGNLTEPVQMGILADTISCAGLAATYLDLGCCEIDVGCNKPISFDNALCPLSTILVNPCNYELTSWVAVLYNIMNGYDLPQSPPAPMGCLIEEYPDLYALMNSLLPI